MSDFPVVRLVAARPHERAKEALAARGHDVESAPDGLTPEVLRGADVVVLSDAPAAPVADALASWVRAGGGAVILGVAGGRLGALARALGVDLDVTTRQAATTGAGMADPIAPEDLLAGLPELTLAGAGPVAARVQQGGDVLVRPVTSPGVDAAGPTVAAAIEAGAGRIALVPDAAMFDDDSFDAAGTRALWVNLVSWAARRPEDGQQAPTASPVTTDPAWLELKDAVEELRPLLGKDGSVDAQAHDLTLATKLVDRIVDAIGGLTSSFEHDAAYLDAVRSDLRRWADGGFGVPDFLDSLMRFHPELQRVDGLEHLVVFPMYTQNGNPSRHLEAVLLRVVWPEWIAELERTSYPNPMFVPVAFEDFTGGYDTNSAVLFPETVAVREVPKFSWGAIFCDREAARFRRVTSAAVETMRLSLPPEAARLLASQRLAQETFVMWDLIHDRTHSRGDLPFDPFMIKQRMPFWLYGLEELRCDLTAFRAAVELEAQGVPHAKLAQYAIFFDRTFRFPVTGGRMRNYDGLGGQLLFAYLHKNRVLNWTDNRLTVDWARLPEVVLGLLAEIEDLYWRSIDRPKISHWIAAYRLVTSYVEPHPGSTWAKGNDALPLDGPPKGLTDAVLPDEFPLSMFFEALKKKIGDVVESTCGITA